VDALRVTAAAEFVGGIDTIIISAGPPRRSRDTHSHFSIGADPEHFAEGYRKAGMPE
jgi:hypothetical protein